MTHTEAEYGGRVQYGTGPNTIPMSTDGTKNWSYNTQGVAHYGMLWDFLQDVRFGAAGGAALVDNNLMYGADYFYHTWQIAETQSAKVK
jgi:hypothetical protein